MEAFTSPLFTRVKGGLKDEAIVGRSVAWI